MPGTGLRRFMVRVANERTNTIIDMTARLMFSIMLPDFTRRYFVLDAGTRQPSRSSP